ncbi:hypothetical protein EVAR_61687_1 [Eumeta japonica]|uniref:Uncharacterized protein n=1 Tax=Eumeta variegata TaxID=151549 RepID=A0A4C2A229_EUMVA|nr:hypothetical protein EVAR_61687_1 [Eumeta japonica]
MTAMQNFDQLPYIHSDGLRDTKIGSQAVAPKVDSGSAAELPRGRRAVRANLLLIKLAKVNKAVKRQCMRRFCNKIPAEIKNLPFYEFKRFVKRK